MVIEIQNKDFREVKIPPGIRVLTVTDPFCGSGTTLKVALDKGYKIMGADIDKKAIEITKKRLIRLRESE